MAIVSQPPLWRPVWGREPIGIHAGCVRCALIFLTVLRALLPAASLRGSHPCPLPFFTFGESPRLRPRAFSEAMLLQSLPVSFFAFGESQGRKPSRKPRFLNPCPLLSLLLASPKAASLLASHDFSILARFFLCFWRVPRPQAFSEATIFESLPASFFAFAEYLQPLLTRFRGFAFFAFANLVASRMMGTRSDWSCIAAMMNMQPQPLGRVMAYGRTIVTNHGPWGSLSFLAIKLHSLPEPSTPSTVHALSHC
jgi:hypothetical protein